MAKATLENYIHLLDRMLENEGLAEIERDEILNDDNNIELISKAFNKRIHPSKIIKQIDRRSIDMMYASMREVNEALTFDDIEMTPGQKYAVNFLKVHGLDFISTPRQLKNGNLVFKDKEGKLWGIFKYGGYLRKNNGSRWGVLYRMEQGRNIDDDEYMELAEMLINKIKKQQNFLKRKEEIWGNMLNISKHNIDRYRNGVKSGYITR